MNNTFRKMALTYSAEEGEEVMAAPILELRSVDKSFGPIDVLHDISLRVHAGEVLCLLGDNGAGKSTLIKTLSGVHKPTSGAVLMDGEGGHLQQPAPGRATRASPPSTSTAGPFR